MTDTEQTTRPTANEEGLTAIVETQIGLSELADWVTANPNISGYLFGTIWIIGSYNNKAWSPTEIVRALTDGAKIGAIRKYPTSDDLILMVERAFTGGVIVQYQAERSDVCTAVTFIEEVELPAEPARPALPARTERVERTDWICEPILAGANGEADVA
jgi:hypothetical protein